jgi:predicted ATP-grasp superfamily ATP-dependent carboligase
VEAEYRKVLPLIRHAAKKGYSVYTISFNRFSIGGSSKYVKKNYYFNLYNIDDFVNVIKKHRIDLIIPCNDASVEFFSKTKHLFDVPIVCPSFEQFRTFRDKLETMRLASKLSIRIPQTIYEEEMDKLYEALKKVDRYPVVIKPRRSEGSRGLKYASSFEDVRNMLTREYIEKYGYPLIQEYIPGQQAIGVSFLYKDGKEIFHICHKRVRQYPVSGGPSTLAMSVYDNEAREIAKKLLDYVSWSGLAMVEFKRDLTTNELVLMEVNPRMWGTIGLALVAGLDVIEAMIDAYHRLRIGEYGYKEGFYLRWYFPGDVLSILRDPHISFKEKFKLILTINAENTVDQILDKDDIKPLFTTLLYSINSKLKNKR